MTFPASILALDRRAAGDDNAANDDGAAWYPWCHAFGCIELDDGDGLCPDHLALWPRVVLGRPLPLGSSLLPPVVEVKETWKKRQDRQYRRYKVRLEE